MSGLTPEQIQESRRLIRETLTNIAAAHLRGDLIRKYESAVRVWEADVAAAESVGKLEKLAESTPHRFTNAEELGPCDLCGCTGDDPIHRQYASLRAQLAAREQQDEKLRGFVKAMMNAFWNPEPGDIDGGEFQDLAEKHGVIVPDIHAAESEDKPDECGCAEGMHCFKLADWLSVPPQTTAENAGDLK